MLRLCWHSIWPIRGPAACVFHPPSPINTQPCTLATTKQASEAAPTVIEGVITGLAPVSCFHGRSTTRRRGLTAPRVAMTSSYHTTNL